MRDKTIKQRFNATAEDKTPNQDGYKIQRNRYGTLALSMIHILPVGITFAILQLSFRNVYWGDADASNQRVKLAALQVAAKVHEILILVSLSSMVLHFTRKLMVAPEGLSFGLLEAAYQSGLCAQPWTIGNWEALKHLRRTIFKREEKGHTGKSGTRFHALHLVVLLVLFAFLALFVGPSSAITMIPQLGWWHRQDLIGPLQNQGGYVAPSFSVYIPTNLFPTEIDQSHLPGSFCGDASKDTNGTCPSARASEVERSFTIPVAGAGSKVQNTTISLDENEDIRRRMLYLQSHRKAAVTVPSYLLASFASLIQLPTFDSEQVYDRDGPFALEMFANGAAPLSPLVGVACNDTTSDLFIREYTYEIDGFPIRDQSKVDLEDVVKTGTFDIRSIWSEEELKQTINGAELTWKDLTETTKTPVLLGLVRHEGNVSVCTVQSYWTSTSQWVLSTSNYDVATNFTYEDPSPEGFLSVFQYPYMLNERQMHIHEDWVETLNAVNGSTKVLDALLISGIKRIGEASISSSSNSTFNSTSASLNAAHKYLESTIAQLLAKSIANGLSRIGAQYAADRFSNAISLNEITICNEDTRWCSQGPWLANGFMPLAVVANTSRHEVVSYFSQSFTTEPYYSWWNDSSPIMRPFSKPVDADVKWTRIEFPVRRYGYAYALQGITTYLSVALLCLHAAIVVVHVVYRVAFDCQIFDFGGSLGSLLLLAMGDSAPGESDMWAKRVAVVPFGKSAEQKKLRLEMVESERDDKVPPADPEELMCLVNASQLEGHESRHASANVRSL